MPTRRSSAACRGSRVFSRRPSAVVADGVDLVCPRWRVRVCWSRRRQVPNGRSCVARCSKCWRPRARGASVQRSGRPDCRGAVTVVAEPPPEQQPPRLRVEHVAGDRTVRHRFGVPPGDDVAGVHRSSRRRKTRNVPPWLATRTRCCGRSRNSCRETGRRSTTTREALAAERPDEAPDVSRALQPREWAVAVRPSPRRPGDRERVGPMCQAWVRIPRIVGDHDGVEQVIPMRWNG